MYKARIVQIGTLTAIPNRDRILAATMKEIPGLTIIVSTNCKVGDVMCYFSENTQLSEEFCKENDLYEKVDLEGKKAGYFNHHRRVKILKLAGVRSEGFLVPLSHFDYLQKSLSEKDFKEFQDNLEPGYEFDKVGSHRICNKYYRAVNITAEERIKRKSLIYRIKSWFKRRADKYGRYDDFDEFKQHKDTAQLRDNITRIPVGATVIVTEKLHGTSATTAKLKCLPWYKKALNYLNPLPFMSFFEEYKLFIGTRNTVLKPGKKFMFRRIIAEKFKNIEPNEQVFNEIVGYEDTGKPIMEPHDLTVLKRDYKIKGFPELMFYNYGCKPGECKEAVYKMSKIVDGIEQVYTWDETIRRCKELGVNTVPELARFEFDGDVEKTLARINSFLANDKCVPSTVDSSHIIEGVCVRVELPSNDVLDSKIGTWTVFKHKSFVFGLLEGYNKEKEIVETEDQVEENQ